eukprot:gene11307-3344_t
MSALLFGMQRQRWSSTYIKKHKHQRILTSTAIDSHRCRDIHIKRHRETYTAVFLCMGCKSPFNLYLSKALAECLPVYFHDCYIDASAIVSPTN